MARTDWRGMARIITWLIVFPPLGLWYLWKDKNLSRAAKIRLLVYGTGGMVVAVVLFAMLEIQLLKNGLANAGVDF